MTEDETTVRGQRGGTNVRFIVVLAITQQPQKTWPIVSSKIAILSLHVQILNIILDVLL